MNGFVKLGFHLDKVGLNAELPKVIADFQPDIIWIEKALALKPAVIKRIRQDLHNRHDNKKKSNPEDPVDPVKKIVHCCEDDMYARHNQSYDWRKSVPLYDVMCTTKSYNVVELPQLGAKKVVMFDNCYDPEFHFSLSTNYSNFHEKRVSDSLCVAVD